MQDCSYGYPVHGLTHEEVEDRRARGLVNENPDTKTKSNWNIIRDNVFTLFNLLNVLIGIALALVDAWRNMLYLSIIFFNSAIGVFQQWHAKQLVEKLSLLSQSHVRVIRDGAVHSCPVDQLVMDDVCIFETGEQICADSQVLHGEVEVNESLLTGEADPVLKIPGSAMLSGSFVVSGRCCAQVEHVGKENFANVISDGAKQHRHMKSQLIRAMDKVAKFTGYFIIPVGLLLFVQAYFFRGNSAFLSVVSTAAALLGMLPKGLVLLISISLAGGVIALSRKKVLVQDLYCIETLAHVDMLCLDKTGTITQGNMQVQEVCWLPAAEGHTGQAGLAAYLASCEDNNATFLALKAYFSPACTWEVCSKIAFSSARKWGSVTFQNIGTYILGAPEKLLGESNALPDSIQRGHLEGDRILCFGYVEGIPDKEKPLDALPLAFFRISDPIRENAVETLSFFKKEGVTIKVISGDNPVTVSSVAQKAGLDGYEKYIDLSSLDTEEALSHAALEYTIFGRVSPAQKRALVQALQTKGHVVAMTGDGVNDVLALHQADCGISIGSGSDAAQQVSGIVLTESNFDALPYILHEGRRVINNINRIAGMFFIKTLYSAFLSLMCLLTASSFPFIPIQITLMDGLLEGLPSLFLAFEPDHSRVSGSFLPTVFLRAFPYATLIFLNYLFLTWVLPLLGNYHFSDGTVLYYISGFIYLLALLRSCVPMNRLRIVLFVFCASSFYFCAFVFSRFLYLEPISIENMGLFSVLALSSLPIIWSLIRLTADFGSKRFKQL